MVYSTRVHLDAVTQTLVWSGGGGGGGGGGLENLPLLTLIHMYPYGASETTVVYKEPSFVDENWFLINVFIREALIEENIPSECIRTIAVTYGCSILQLCECDANV